MRSCVRVYAAYCWVVERGVDQASKSFVRPDAGSQGMVKVGSEANITSVPGAMTSNHSASAVNLAAASSTPPLTVKSNNVGTAPTVTLTNLVAVITDVRTLVTEVVDFVCLHLNATDATCYPHMPVVCLLFVCNFVRLRISPARIKLAAFNFARWFRGVLDKESTILGNFAAPEAQNRTNRPPPGSIAQDVYSHPIVNVTLHVRHSLNVTWRVDVGRHVWI